MSGLSLVLGLLLHFLDQVLITCILNVTLSLGMVLGLPLGLGLLIITADLMLVTCVLVVPLSKGMVLGLLLGLLVGLLPVTACLRLPSSRVLDK